MAQRSINVRQASRAFSEAHGRRPRSEQELVDFINEPSTRRHQQIVSPRINWERQQYQSNLQLKTRAEARRERQEAYRENALLVRQKMAEVAEVRRNQQEEQKKIALTRRVQMAEAEERRRLEEMAIRQRKMELQYQRAGKLPPASIGEDILGTRPGRSRAQNLYFISKGIVGKASDKLRLMRARSHATTQIAGVTEGSYVYAKDKEGNRIPVFKPKIYGSAEEMNEHTRQYVQTTQGGLGSAIQPTMRGKILHAIRPTRFQKNVYKGSSGAGQGISETQRATRISSESAGLPYKIQPTSWDVSLKTTPGITDMPEDEPTAYTNQPTSPKTIYSTTTYPNTTSIKPILRVNLKQKPTPEKYKPYNIKVKGEAELTENKPAFGKILPEKKIGVSIPQTTPTKEYTLSVPPATAVRPTFGEQSPPPPKESKVEHISVYEGLMNPDKPFSKINKGINVSTNPEEKTYQGRGLNEWLLKEQQKEVQKMHDFNDKWKGEIKSGLTTAQAAKLNMPGRTPSQKQGIIREVKRYWFPEHPAETNPNIDVAAQMDSDWTSELDSSLSYQEQLEEIQRKAKNRNKEEYDERGF